MRRLRTHIMHRLRLRESWIIFFIIGFIMMTFPFLHIFNKPVLIFGIPLLFLYLTFGWLVSIVIIYLFVIAGRSDDKSPDEKGGP